MEIFGIKITILAGAIAGAIYRVMFSQSKSTTLWGILLDKVSTLCLSIFLALLLLNPVITFLGVSVAYLSVVAMALALFSHDVVTQLLEAMRNCNLERAIRFYAAKWLRRKFGDK